MKLNEATNILLSNLKEVDKEFINSLLKDLEYTSIAHYENVIRESLRFHEEHGEFPDAEYLSSGYIEFVEREIPFSPSVKKEFESLFNKEVLTFKASELLQKGDLEAAGQVLASRNDHKEQKSRKIGLEGILDEYNRLSSGPSGILLAVPEVDDIAKGCSYSTITFIGAPAGHGKTTAAISTAYVNSIKNGFNGVYLTLEIAERDWWFSVLARHSMEMGMPLSAESIKKMLLTPEEVEILGKVKNDLEENAKGKLHLLTVEDFDTFSFEEMERKFNSIEEEMGELDFFVVDYIQLFKFYRPKHMSPEEYCNAVIRFFGQFAIKANKGRGCVGIILSQVNREWERRLGKINRGSMSAFAELNEIERTAHLAVVLYSSERDRLSNQIGTAIVKNRTGLIREELQRAYADFEHFLIGSSDFQGIFSGDNLELLDVSDSGDLFN